MRRGQRRRALSSQPTQVLPAEAYTSEEWFQREQIELFGRSWILAGVTSDAPRSGDYFTVRAGAYPLVVVRGADGELRAFHNLCRCTGRGIEMLEESRGSAGESLVCPAHGRVYALDGSFRGTTDREMARSDVRPYPMGLGRASLGVHKDLVFVNAQAEPDEPFSDWIADLPDWPHNLVDGSIAETTYDVVYEFRANWKVVFENTIDGYHLSQLHRSTFGGPEPSKNRWDVHGRHLVWHATDQPDRQTCAPKRMLAYAEQFRWEAIPGAENPEYCGVAMMFPTTFIGPSPWGLRVSTFVPVAPDLTLQHRRYFVPPNRVGDADQDLQGLDRETGTIKVDHFERHAMETGDFQLEDMWIIENMQRALNSPMYSVSRLALGAGGEAPLTFFQQNVLDFVSSRPDSPR